MPGRLALLTGSPRWGRLLVGYYLVPGLEAQLGRLNRAIERAAREAHVSFVDGSAVLERDGQRDSAPANMPLLAGDRLRTQNGRVEILFADNSTLHLLAAMRAEDRTSCEIPRVRLRPRKVAVG